MKLPDLRQAADAHTAASLLVQAGWAVVPVSQGNKSPGSLLGNGWPDQSARTPADVDRLWGLYPDSAVAIHHGGSRPRTVAIDVDNVSLAPSDLLHALTETRAFVSSRDNDADRGHHLFLVPDGRDLSNSPAGLAGMGLDVKTGNAVTVAWGRHKKASEGGRYLAEGGEVALLPEWIACRLADRGVTGQADDAAVAAFLAALPGGTCDPVTDARDRGVAELARAKASHDRGGPGRHEPGLRIVKGLVRLGERRFPGVREALAEVESAFMAGRERDFGGRADWPRNLRGAVGAVLADPSASGDLFVDIEPMLATMQARQEKERATVGTAPAEPEPVETRENPLRARLFDREALRSIPPVRWLVEGTLPEHSVTVLSGRTQTLKTFLALDLALSHATGGEWFGRAAGRGRVLLVLAEGFEGIAGRIEAWEAEHGPVPAEALTVLRGAVQLADDQQVADLCEIVSEGGYSVVVVDTYAKSTVGLVENSNDDATIATGALYRIADATREGRGAVLVIAHATKYRDEATGKRTARGAGALTDNIDGQYDLERISETEVLVERVKVKEAELHDTFRMTFRASGPSIVLDYAEIGAEDIPVRKNGQALEVDRQHERVLALLAKGKALDASSVGSSLGVSDVTALKYLRRLHKLEKVQEGGTERHRFYSLAGPP